MNKLGLIIKREYLTRVRKRAFIIGTIVTPLAILLFMALITYIFSYQGSENQKIVIRDEAQLLHKTMKDGRGVYFSFSEKPLAALKASVKSGEFDGVLVVPPLVDLKKKAADTVEDPDKIGEGVRFEVFLWAISLYFLCATTVHPWYAAMPLAISVFTRFNYIALWTCVLPMTYIHYSYPTPTENYWVIGLEYLLVIGFFIYEMAFYRFSLKNRLINSEQSS